MATNPFYQDSGNPPAQTRGTSASIRAEFVNLQYGFDLVYAQTGTALPASIAAKGSITGQAWTGTHDFSGASSVLVPTPTLVNQAVTKAYADGLSFATVLPAQAGNAGKVVTTNGTAASWAVNNPLSTVNAVVTANTTLTTSFLYVPVAMATVGQSVTLPAANTLSLGGPQYIIRNTGTLAFNVRDNTGVLIASVPVRGEIIIMLSANGTSAGTWAIGNASEFGFLNTLSIGTASVVEAVADTGYNFSCAALSSTSFILVYNGVSGYSRACVCTLSGSTITPGAPVTIEAFNGVEVSVSTISSTQAIATYQGASSYPRACILNISGTTIIPATPITIQAAAVSPGSSVSILNSTQAIFLFAPSSTMYPTACILNISGSVITPSTPVTISAVANSYNYYSALVALSSTTAMALYIGTSSYPTAVVLSVVNSIITVNTPIILESVSATGSYMSAVVLSSTQIIVMYGLSTPYSIHCCPIAVSGVSLTGSSPTSVVTTSINGGGTSLLAISTTSGYAYYATTAGYYSISYVISGSTVNISTPVLVSNIIGSSGYCFAVLLSSAMTILCTSGVSNYPNSISVEYVK